MQWLHPSYRIAAIFAAVALSLPGCGTTRSSDTARTATEQLLISDAIDRAVQTMDVRALAGQTVFLDDSKLAESVDKNYLISTLRQYLLDNGCKIREKREDAEFVVEARSGAIGTDSNDLLFGLPSINVPQIPLVQPVPAVIPEIPIAKRKDQRGVAKIAIFAYHRETGAPVWQSGLVEQESSANNVWILGAGPFQRGTIYHATEFAGNSIHGEGSDTKAGARRLPTVDLARQKLFTPPQQFAKQAPAADQKVVQAAHQEPAPATTPKPATPAAPAAAGPAAVQTAAKPQPTPSAAAPPPGLASNTDPKKLPATTSVYLQPTDATSVSQPRYNSPK
ncbi:MAG TPA: DUF6655 family protein [Lacipirellulaceae bacterium]|nr:DUF6655 family protein [Lacipirellulaceae bacterium]